MSLINLHVDFIREHFVLLNYDVDNFCKDHLVQRLNGPIVEDIGGLDYDSVVFLTKRAVIDFNKFWDTQFRILDLGRRWLKRDKSGKFAVLFELSTGEYDQDYLLLDVADLEQMDQEGPRNALAQRLVAESLSAARSATGSYIWGLNPVKLRKR
ncbi:MAG: hypothetical protein MMC23_000954 [Stictis urceolatum]|nr:hypothetical protein [Stictis urceolata]